MKGAPPLADGEDVLFDHVPSLKVYKRTALLMIVLTLPVVAVFLYVFPDSLWPVVPLFVTCFLLMQERFSLGRYRAWITNRRIILQGGREIGLGEVTGAEAKGNGVRIGVAGHRGKGVKLFYSEDKAALLATIRDARGALNDTD